MRAAPVPRPRWRRWKRRGRWRIRCRSRRTRPQSMALRSTTTASAAPRSSCCPIRTSALPMSRGSGRSSLRFDAEDRRAARNRRQIRGLSRPPDRRHRILSPRRELRAARRARLRGAAGPLERSPAEAADAAAAHHRPGRPDRRHHAGGADACWSPMSRRARARAARPPDHGAKHDPNSRLTWPRTAPARCS